MIFSALAEQINLGLTPRVPRRNRKPWKHDERPAVATKVMTLIHKTWQVLGTE